MYYKEKKIDGIWHFKNHPKGRWQVMGLIELSCKIEELEREIEKLRKAIDYKKL